MKIEISDVIAEKCELNEQEALELFAIALYKFKGIHGSLAGKILDISEFEFHNLLAEKGEAVNYGVDDLINDLKNDI